MGEDKLNSDNENRKSKKSTWQDDNQYQKKIIDDITQQYKNIYEYASMQQPVSDTSDTTNCFDIKSLADKAVNINILRYEVDRLQLDFKAKAYFENDVKPLIDTLYSLATASISYSSAAGSLANTNFGRSSKIKDALNLVEGVNEISEDLIKVLKCKIDNMLKLAKYDCK
ncbi:hypothetical protein [Clostridium tagluense]|uniref:Uncharacterized protein n=1 Tax=Clostridium tagluense TaxID=360422 RepID=A0A401UPD4_9CLOT|nr:hypothetical protein [Clostridium tagluense]MCB2299626.1 hypothetical protein [Clostridium tagluense]GCD11386.1 hypothetical protein Ctaglu_30090 [Clostridium tagluense]